MGILYSPWTSQPQQAVGIDWGNPITRGLVIAAIPSHRSAMDKLATVPGSFDVVSGLNGMALKSNGSTTSHVYWPIPRKDYGTRTTLLSFCSAPAQASVLRAAVSVGSTSSSTPFMRLGSLGAVSSLGASYRSDESTDFRSSDIANVFDSTPKIAICVTNDAEQRLFVNGVVGATRSTVAGWACTVDTFSIGAHQRAGSVSDRFEGNHFFGAFWERPLSDAEVRSISQNPWQIFKPLPRRIFVPVSAATGDGTGTGSLYSVTLSFPTGTASGTGAVNGTGTGDFAASSLAAPSATATGSALATGALTTVTLTTVTASANGSALATGSLDAIDLSTVSGTATGTTAGNAEGVGSVATIALSAPSASAVGSALATGSFSHISLSAVSGTASAATNGQATADLQPISISAPLAIAIASSVATGGIQSIGLTAPNASATGQAQTIARPGSDTSNSGWAPSTGADLYAMIDEVSPDDADYISTASAGSVCRLGLGAVADPGTSSGQVVSYRASSSTGNGLLVELMQGGTVIATWNHATLPATDTTYQQSLSAAECDAITDYTALSVRLTSL